MWFQSQRASSSSSRGVAAIRDRSIMALGGIPMGRELQSSTVGGSHRLSDLSRNCLPNSPQPRLGLCHGCGDEWPLGRCVRLTLGAIPRRQIALEGRVRRADLRVGAQIVTEEQVAPVLRAVLSTDY
jgi:hypothetical protein